jgi:hypothetical protein
MNFQEDGMENLAQWYPKLDAARRLGISERT